MTSLYWDGTQETMRHLGGGGGQFLWDLADASAGSSAAETPAKFQSDTDILTPDLAPSGLCAVLSDIDLFLRVSNCLIETRPCIHALIITVRSIWLVTVLCQSITCNSADFSDSLHPQNGGRRGDCYYRCLRLGSLWWRPRAGPVDARWSPGLPFGFRHRNH